MAILYISLTLFSKYWLKWIFRLIERFYSVIFATLLEFFERLKLVPGTLNGNVVEWNKKIFFIGFTCSVVSLHGAYQDYILIIDLAVVNNVCFINRLSQWGFKSKAML